MLDEEVVEVSGVGLAVEAVGEVEGAAGAVDVGEEARTGTRSGYQLPS